MALAALLGLSAAGLHPSLLHTPWVGLSTAFQVSHPLFLGTLALVLVLAAVPLELRLGRLSLLAAWGLPSLVQFWIWGRARAEVTSVALLVMLLVVAYRRQEGVPLKVWVPLGMAVLLTLWISAPPPLSLVLTVGIGAALGWFSRTEAVAVLGMACGGALLLAWLS